jgi:hypothetical protein
VGEFVHEYPSEQSEGNDGTENVGHIAFSDKGSVNRNLEDLIEHPGSDRYLAADDPGKEGNDQDKRIVDQDRNPKNAPDTKRPVHDKGLSF